MNRCFAEPPQLLQPELTLSTAGSRHLARVLRARPGDAVTLMDGQGHTAQATIISTRHSGVRVQIREETRCYQPPPPVAIILVQALAKPLSMDWIVQKATELGVRAVWPLLTARVIVKTDRCDRWRKIAQEAAKQSGVAWLPDIQPVRALPDILPRLPEFSAWFVASLHEDARPFRAVLNAAVHKTPMSLALIIGPEGDLTAEETLALTKAGGIPVRFGPTILRTETAALYGLSVLTHEFASGDESP